MRKISRDDIKEIRNRDFLKKIDHYHDFDDIKTNLLLGSWDSEVELSIILPVYDHPIEFIKRAINSVLNQPCSYSYKLLVIDDYALEKNATATEQYLRELNSENIVYYKNEKNLGVFGNWNRAIMLSNAKWISFLHSDDFYKDNYLENMMQIICENTDIDQLCCNYKLLNYKKDKIDSNKEYNGSEGIRTVRKVNYHEYTYQMVTSVKGSIYRKDKLIDIGGFRSQGDGIGLDDYPLMLKFAYYYNTYLLEDVLYLDSWGYNDSLNPKHWYPDLVENYYLWKYLANQEIGIVKAIYLKRAKQLAVWRAKRLKSGKSWVGIPIEFEYEEFMEDCEIESMNMNIFSQLIIKCIVYFLEKKKCSSNKKYNVHIIKSEPECFLKSII